MMSDERHRRGQDITEVTKLREWKDGCALNRKRGVLKRGKLREI